MKLLIETEKYFVETKICVNLQTKKTNFSEAKHHLCLKYKIPSSERLTLVHSRLRVLMNFVTASSQTAKSVDIGIWEL